MCSSDLVSIVSPSPEYVKMGDRFFAAGYYRHLLPVIRTVPDRSYNFTAAGSNCSAHQSNIFMYGSMLLELLRQLLVRPVILSYDQSARSIFIQTMYDTGTFFATAVRQRSKVVEQCISQSIIILTCAGMHY